REVPDDQRLVALADVRELTIVRDDAGRITGLPQLERILDACLDGLRSARSADRELARLDWNRIKLYVWPTVEAPLAELGPVIRSLAARTEALGLEQVMVQFRDADSRERMLRMSRPPGAGLTLRVTDPPTGPLRELNPYTQNVIRARRRGTVYPYELIPLITRSPDPGGADGEFTEYDLDDSGTETMDWISRALRGIVEFTQAGGEINVVVTGINVGAQPYWNAEATMLMHTSGVLIMTPDSAMVLTGKQSLDYSGGVSAEDNFGIGGYDRIMGPNGQAQYWAPNLTAAVEVLRRHYDHAYVAPGERWGRPARTSDPRDRDV